MQLHKENLFGVFVSMCISKNLSSKADVVVRVYAPIWEGVVNPSAWRQASSCPWSPQPLHYTLLSTDSAAYARRRHLPSSFIQSAIQALYRLHIRSTHRPHHPLPISLPVYIIVWTDHVELPFVHLLVQVVSYLLWLPGSIWLGGMVALGDSGECPPWYQKMHTR